MEGMFDLEMALSMMTMEENYILTKLILRKSFNQNQLISEMPTVELADGSECCSICMEDFESNVSGKRVPCGHVFHSTCISRWLSEYNSCPLCRSTVLSAT